jgi:hypothetical protein
MGTIVGLARDGGHHLAVLPYSRVAKLFQERQVPSKSSSMVIRRQRGNLRSRRGWINDGCSTKTIIFVCKGGRHVIAEQRNDGSVLTIGHRQRAAGVAVVL